MALYRIFVPMAESQTTHSQLFGSRMTDDGIKAAATNSMSVLTQVEGVYDSHLNKHQTPCRFPLGKMLLMMG